MSSSLIALKAQTEAGSAEQKRIAEKKKSILLLINEYLNENGFLETARKLSGESGGLISKFAAADNVDLMLILSEYEAYYEMRFGKKPKLIRKLQDGESNPHAPRVPEAPVSNKKSGGGAKSQTNSNGSDKLPSIPGDKSQQSTSNNTNSNNTNPEDDNGLLGVQGTSVNMAASKSKRSESETNDNFEERYIQCHVLISSPNDNSQSNPVITYRFLCAMYVLSVF